MPPPAPVEDRNEHHKQGMSALNYLAACSGFESRSSTSEAAEDGTRLHDLMESVTRLALAQGKLMQECLPLVMQGATTSEEEESYLRYCCKEVDYWYWLRKKAEKIFVERRIYIRHADRRVLNFGRCDLFLGRDESGGVLIDYKFGRHAVPAAANNWQGKGYATGLFQEFPLLQKIVVIFIQPRLQYTTRHVFNRKELPTMFEDIKAIVLNAQATQEKLLRPGVYCDYCGTAAVCKALLNDAQRAIAIHEGLPMPQTFRGLKIETPEEAAHALYVLQRLEVLIEESGLKEKARELARANNGTISCTLPNGQQVAYDLKRRKAARRIDSPVLVAEALQGIMTPAQVLDACEIRVTTLEENFADAYTEQKNAQAETVLKEAELRAAPVKDRELAKAILKAAKEEAKAIRVTKKEAAETLNSLLANEGLITSPGAVVEYLKPRAAAAPTRTAIETHGDKLTEQQAHAN